MTYCICILDSNSSYHTLFSSDNGIITLDFYNEHVDSDFANLPEILTLNKHTLKLMCTEILVVDMNATQQANMALVKNDAVSFAMLNCQ